MNKFTKAENNAATYIVESVKRLYTAHASIYAQPQDAQAAAEALLNLVIERLQSPKVPE